MVPLITSQTHIPNYSHLNHPLTLSPIHLHTIKKTPKIIHIKSSTHLTSFGFNKELNKGTNFINSWRCWCTQSEGDVDLEAEIMGFMEKSERPTIFPSKKDLIEARRCDLAEAIKRRGGWFSLGWDEDENVGKCDEDSVGEGMDNDIEEFKKRVESCKETASLIDNDGSDFSSGVESDVDSPSSLRLFSVVFRKNAAFMLDYVILFALNLFIM